MPRIIFKCPHIKGGSQKAISHLGNLVSYIATREGVELVAQDKPVTQKQKEMVTKLLREFPLSSGLFEYADYQAKPTQANASGFISRAIEDNYDQIAKKENYLQYIAQRPGVQQMGSHGLFNGGNDSLVLSQVANEIAHHPGTVWLPIISLHREDAARLGYDNAKNWQALLAAHAPEIAQAMKIPLENFRWYAAFHDEGHHPHVHMVCYSINPKEGFLTKTGIEKIKSGLARGIFRQDLTAIYQQQTRHRDELTREAGESMRQLVGQMQNGMLENERIEQLMVELARRLKRTKGKKQYGYLKAPLKAIVDEIVDELEKDARVATAYDLWYRLREEVLRTYKDTMPQRVPLSQQKEFKRIKNLVIEEAVRLGEDEAVFSPMDEQANERIRYSGDRRNDYLLTCMARLLHHMGKLFREQSLPSTHGIGFVDSKLRRKIQEKKIAMGHKPDDHEPRMS